MQERTIELPDGRALSVVTGATPGQRAVVLQHGTPSDALSWDGWEAAIAARGLMLVAADRAGYATSSRHHGRDIAAAAGDIAAALQALGVEEFVTIGVSGGGPHALACAALTPTCRAAATLAGVGPSDDPALDFLAGMGPENVDEFGAASAGEEALVAWMAVQGEPMRTISAAAITDAVGGLLPEVDRDPGYIADWARGLHRGLAHGLAGWIDDDLAFARPWGFDLARIAVPVDVWQGDLDLMVPRAHGAYLADRITTATARPAPGEGHLSLPYRHRDEILTTLLRSAGWA